MDRYLYKDSELPEKEIMPGVWLKSIHRGSQLVTLVTFKPFSRVPEHEHTEQQISVIINGKMDVIIGGTRMTAQKGDVLVVPSGIPHSVEVSARGAQAVETWPHVIDEYVVDEAPPAGGDVE